LDYQISQQVAVAAVADQLVVLQQTEDRVDLVVVVQQQQVLLVEELEQ
tara:strand:- start:425 stop:568 length:144 start_codon:yes stop_codon:yes gene_type:complete